MDTSKYVSTSMVKEQLENEISAEILKDLASIVYQARRAADMEDARAALATLTAEQAAAGKLFAELTTRLEDLRTQHNTWRRELETMEDKRARGEVDQGAFRIDHAKIVKKVKDLASEIRLLETRARGAEDLENTKKGHKVRHKGLLAQLEAIEFPETHAADILKAYFTKKR